jgi:hypothetical protein
LLVAVLSLHALDEAYLAAAADVERLVEGAS